MPRDLNQCLFTGNLSTDVRLFETLDKRPGAEFTLAVNDYWKDGSGNPNERTDFIGIVCYGDVTAAARALQRGDRIVVTGKMRNEKIPKSDGKIESKTKLRALTLATQREIKPNRPQSQP